MKEVYLSNIKCPHCEDYLLEDGRGLLQCGNLCLPHLMTLNEVTNRKASLLEQEVEKALESVKRMEKARRDTLNELSQ